MARLSELIVTGLGTAFVVEVAAKTVVLLAFTALLARLARRGSSATRHAVWVVGLTAIVVIPLASTVLPEVALPVLVGEPSAGAAGGPRAEVAGEAVPVGSDRSSARRGDAWDDHAVAGDQVGPLAPRKARSSIPLTGWIFVLWLGGALLAVLRLAADRIRVGMLTRQTSRPASRRAQVVATRLARQLGVRRSIRVLESGWFAVPATWGVMRPVVVLPCEADAWDQERLRVVLLHELAHVRRWDYLTNVLSELACAIHWPNPLVWLAARRAHQEQEQACDDAVLRVGTQSADYATHLVEIARALTPRQAAVPGALAMAAPATLMDRVRAILSPDSNREPTARRTVSVAMLAAVAVVLPLASANVLGSSYRLRAIRSLAGELRSGAPGERTEAAWALGRYRTRDAVTALASGLHDPAPEVRGAAALSLGEVARPDAVKPLLRALRDPDPFVRENAVLALYRFDEPRARKAVLGMTDDPFAGVRSVAVWTLGEIGSEPAADALSQVIAHDEDEHTRSMAMGALVSMERNVALPRLLGALRANEVTVRVDAAYGLGALGDKRAIEALVATMLEDPDGDVRTAAARGLDRLADERALDGLLQALDDSVRHVRQAAVRALGKLDGPRARAGVLQALRDPVHQVRLTAVWVLQGVTE